MRSNLECLKDNEFFFLDGNKIICINKDKI